jgi:superfamily II DNA or RNA helicase
MPCLILVKRLAHGNLLQQELQAASFLVQFTHGKLSRGERQRMYSEFKSGAVTTLIASGIYDDSIDIPDIEVLINASGGKSKIATKQKLGRGLRNPGEKELVMVDFYDRHHKILRRHSNRRMREYEKEGFEVIQVTKVSDIFS